MKDVLIGLLTGMTAVVATTLLTPRPQSSKLSVRELAPTDDLYFSRLAREYLPTSDPDPVRLKLERTTASLRVSSAQLETVVKQLADASGQNFYVDWAAIQGFGIGTNDRITLNLVNLPISTLLKAALKETGGQKARLGYRVIDGVVRISTEDDLSHYSVTRVYNVRDIIEKEIAWSAEHAKNTLAPEAAADSLVQLITQTIDPSSWRSIATASDLGNSTKTVITFGDLLVITQTPENQDAILGLLSALQRSNQPWPTTLAIPSQDRQ